jgi:hypothetical protein
MALGFAPMRSTDRVAFFLLFMAVLAGAPGCGGPVETPDGGSDAASDGNVDAGATCTSDAMCDDGLFCTGVEHCTAGRCAVSAAPDCGDAIACTIDRCSEELRACVHAVPDVDADGHGDASCSDGAGVPLGDDCDDHDDAAFPGATEICDDAGHDEDCDPATHGQVDADSDGFEAARCCNGTSCGTDCNDGVRSASPDATEVCNGIDDDCDTLIDEGVSVAGFADDDRDGYGDDARAMASCGDAAGFSTRPGDCDDTSIEVHRGQPELCDVLDNDCDGRVDEMAGAVDWFVDTDGDGFGTTATTMRSCSRPTGYSILATDCDDTTSSRSPRAAEACNALDDDCNGRADYAITPGNLEDDDGDLVADVGCGLPRGLDCDDYGLATHPGADEICNGLDDDCDTRVDESATSVTFHRDADADGYGDRGTAVIACFAPAGYVLDATDCDDRAAARHPGALEACDAIDGDCDHRIDETPAESTCAIPHATASCTVGVCHLSACAPGYADCSAAAGCETNTSGDPLHCGGCSPCLSGDVCIASHCAPSTGSVGLYTSAGSDAVTAIGTSLDDSFVVGGRYEGTFSGSCGAIPSATNVGTFLERRNYDGSCNLLLGLDGNGDERITGVAIDDSDNIYVSAITTSGALDFSGGASISAPAHGGEDGIVFSLDPAGTLRWSFRFGGAGDDHANGVVVTGTDVFVACGVVAPVSLDATHTFPMHAGARDACVVRLDRATGLVLSARSVTPTGAGDGEALALDVDVVTGDVLVGGVVSTDTSFGGTPSSVVPVGASDGFVWRLSASLVSSSVYPVTGSGDTRVSGLTVADGNVYVGGSFTGDVTYGTRALTASGGATDQDGFVYFISLASGLSSFGRAIGGPGSDAILGLDALAGSGRVSGVGTLGAGYTDIAGYFRSPAGGTDGFLVSFETGMGFTTRAEVFDGAGDSSGLAVSCGTMETHFGGEFEGATVFLGLAYPDFGGGVNGVWASSPDFGGG